MGPSQELEGVILQLRNRAHKRGFCKFVRAPQGPCSGPRSSRDLEKRKMPQMGRSGRLHVGSSIWARFEGQAAFGQKGDTFQTERKSRRKEKALENGINLDGGEGDGGIQNLL